MTVEVLLVEDNETDIEILKKAMSKTLFENHINVANDGIEALEYLQDENIALPDFILLDLTMPRMDGHQVLKWIKSHDNFRNIPVGILRTAAPEEADNSELAKMPGYYIDKPAEGMDLNFTTEAIDNFWSAALSALKVDA